MRQIIFALAFVLSSLAAPGARADILQADAQILRSCVASAGQDRAALQQCYGAMTRSCVEAEGGSNSMTDVLCRSVEYETWQVLVEEASARIAAADPRDGELLAASNAVWTQWREAECEYRAYEFGGGSGEQFERVVCYLDLTSARAIDLILR